MTAALMPTYARCDIAFEKGEGAYLFTADGRRYLDFASGIGVTMLGHSHPHLVAALETQARKLWHCSNIFRIPEQERLAERLVANSFADQVFFCNSGAEAVECAIKLIRKYHKDSGNPQRSRIICCTGAFHGRTLATISAGGQEKHTAGFEPLLDGFDHVGYENLNELRAAITDETAAIMVEPVLGEGGIRAASIEYLKSLREVADEFGLLLIFDEVQCGTGRTGKLFAHEWAEISPDVLTTAKGLGGGFPVGACLATDRAAVGMVAGTHGSTFGGNPLAMAVANAVLDVVLEDGFLDRVKGVADLMWGRLESLVDSKPAIFSEVRGAGLMLGLKCVVPSGEMVEALRSAALLTVGAGENVVRLSPPLIIEQQHVDEAVGIIENTAASWRTENG